MKRSSISWRLRWAILLLSSWGGLFPCDTQAISPEVSREADARPPAEELKSRRGRLQLKDSSEMVIVEAGGGEGVEVTRDFEYLTGLHVWGGILIVSGSSLENESVLFLPKKDPDFELWHGPRLAPDASTQRLTGVSAIQPLSQLSEWLENKLKTTETVFHSLPGEASQPAIWDRLKISDDVQLRSAKTLLHPHRQIKSDWEQQQMIHAIRRTHQGLQAGAALASQVKNECEIEAAIEARFRSQGSIAPGFPSIVGSGNNSCILHWQKNNGPLVMGSVLLMDVGARSGPYTADITRTVPVSGQWTERQKEIYTVVLAAQKAGMEAVKPGATIGSIDAAARAVIREAGYEEYFPHGTSHHVGLDVHDVGPRRAFQPGMVVTVEPGIYIAEEQLGIRIEDIVVVTETGFEILSAMIPRDAETMEKWVSARKKKIAEPVEEKKRGVESL
ncbi:MAG: Xaa-Pro peptidase family protein [Planctomycetota bacterium]|nr:Xaa-Pro peptidase family protein [Planctomycetota bacterium]